MPQKRIMRFIFKYLIVLIFGLNSLHLSAQTTSWRGVTSTNWTTASNWTSGVPTSAVDAIIGDANFTGVFQPALNGTSTCKNLTIGSGTKASSLSIVSNITVWGNLLIGSNGTITANNSNRTITLRGNWTKQGVYTAGSSSAGVILSGGVVQTITGSTTFRRLTVNTNTTLLLANNITVNNTLTVNGTFNPTDAYSVNGTGNLSVGSSGTLMVYAAAFSGNYALTGSKSLNRSSTVDYAAETLAQTISSSIVYGKLRFSGGSTKSLLASSTTALDQLAIDNNLIFNAGTSTTILVNGSITNNGTIEGQSSVIRMDGSPSDISGTGVSNFNHLVVENSASLTLNASINIKGNMVIDGNFTGTGRKVSFIGLANSTISGSASSIVFGDLEQNKTFGYTALAAPISITGQLSLLNGKINTTAASYINMADNSTTSSGSDASFVNGPMRKTGNDAFVFPIGKGSKWARLGISAPSNTSHAFTAEYFDAAYSNTNSMATLPSPALNNVSIIEYWDCARSVGTSAVTVQLFWENTLSGINNYSSDLVVAHWNGSAWENKGQTSISGGVKGSITSTTNTSFSPFTFGSLSPSFNPLPITLLDFDGRLNANNMVELNWTTVSETNNKFFTVERSVDGKFFTPLVEVQAAGNSNAVVEYSALDAKPYAATTYYRLKQTDFDGKVSYSKNIVSVYNELKPFAWSVYPNPSNGLVQIDFDTNEIGVLTVKNSMGCTVLSLDIEDLQSRIDLTHLPNGVYIIYIETVSMSETYKLIKS